MNKNLIFVVDDDTLSRMLVERPLQKNNNNVEAFESSEECLIRLTEKQPDLLLLDINIPKMNGFELCRKVKNNKKTGLLEVVWAKTHDDQMAVAVERGLLS